MPPAAGAASASSVASPAPASSVVPSQSPSGALSPPLLLFLSVSLLFNLTLLRPIPRLPYLLIPVFFFTGLLTVPV
jgi:hypothetical protein